MIDGSDNYAAWERHAGDILILPVGAFEQHGLHLPLKTDILHAVRTAEVLARHFNAALLPALPIANSLEHSGSRGSFSLRPDTLMRVIRDIADEAETQNFHFLIVVSGHGGNFALNPICRDINRRDRGIKLIPVFPTEFYDFHDMECTERHIMDIHAGEIETSLYLALGEKLISPLPERRSAQTDGGSYPWRRQDLNMFGMTVLNPDGYLGIPDAATREKGEKIMREIDRNLISYLEDRIARLRRQPRYGGAGGIAMRELLPADMPDLLNLSGAAGWNQTETDWSFLMEHAPVTSLGFAHRGKVVASAVLLPYPDGAAWIGMVIVAPDWRGNRLAGRLLSELMARHGKTRICKLDATPAGIPVYQKLGFRCETRIVRLVRHSGDTGRRQGGIRPMTSEDLLQLVAADRESFHADRSDLMRHLHQSASPALTDGDGAFLLSRPGRRFRQIGPVFAPAPEAALRLVDAAGAGGTPLVIDVPECQTDFLEKLAEHGFRAQRDFTRMGINGDGEEDLRKTFAIAGPEFG